MIVLKTGVETTFYNECTQIAIMLVQFAHLGSLVPRSVFCSRYVPPLWGGKNKVRFEHETIYWKLKLGYYY